MHNVSIIRLISFFFVIALLIINGSFIIEYKRQIKDIEYFTFQRFMLGMRMRENDDPNAPQALAKIGLRNSSLSKLEIRENGKKILEDSYCDMIQYQKKLYFVPRDPLPPEKSLLRIMLLAGIKVSAEGNKISMNDKPALENIEEFSLHNLWILWGTINSVTIIFFSIVLRKLLRLRNLKSAIRVAGDSNKFEAIPIDSNDELGQIATEFNLAMKKLHLMKEARTLFLRNILHELRTPVMKGKILASIIKDEEFKDQLRQIFIRQEVLVGEMVKVEKLTSNEWKLAKKEYRLVDIIDHAIDLLLMKNKDRIEINAEDKTPVLLVDFELFSTAIKNLIDNALKYSKDHIVIDIYQDSLRIGNTGEKIPEQRLDFTRAFNREVESTNSGLGLGLYIANQIFLKHDCELTYQYINTTNYFLLHFMAVSNNLLELKSKV